ncbi:MAG: hypothetical protein EOP02_07380 [Proteobacteria bacterium]|nr:MAG: hypothetical protein EOP02_07380 [Pseudomonadota bacterium]
MSNENSPNWALRGGVAAVFGTGLMALSYGFMEGGDSLVMAIIVIVITLAGMIALARFVAKHGDEIGEARFDTRNKDERQE